MHARSNPLRSLFTWIGNQIVQPVPETDALCEFDCKNNDCTVGHWVTCERRLKHAANELMPEELVSPDLSNE